MRHWSAFILAHLLNGAMAGDNDQASSCVLTRTLPVITTEACPGNGHGIATAFAPTGTQPLAPDSPNPGESGAFTRSSHPTGTNSGLGLPKNSNAADLGPGAVSPHTPSSSEPESQSGVPSPDTSGVPGTNKQLDRPERSDTPESPGSGSGSDSDSDTTTASDSTETPVVVGSDGSSIRIDQGIMIFAGLVAGLGPIVIS